MNAKNLMVFFFALASILLLVSPIVSARSIGNSNQLASIESIKIDDVFAMGSEVSVEAGSSVTVKVMFTALVDAADVRFKLNLEGEKVDSESVSSSFNVEQGQKYSKTLTLAIPYELQDEVSSDLTLAVKLWNGDYRTEDNSISLRVQRPSYSASIMSIDSVQSVEAGELLPVDIVLKNNGYNNLDNLYVTVKIAELGLERTSYFGDLQSIEDKHNSDTETKRFYLDVPFDAQAGSYTLEVEASNADMSVSGSKDIVVLNEFLGSTVITSMKKAVSVGSEAEFEIIVANPTDKLRVFRIVTESNGDLTTSVDEQLVAVPAGMTKVVTVTAEPESQGEYDFNVSVFAGEELVDSVTLSVLASGRSASSGSVVALTIILAVIFLVLLGALFALLRKKPVEQAEEFGESYY